MCADTAGQAPPGGRLGRVRTFLAARLDRRAYLGLHLTIGLVVAAGGVWLFGALLEEVLDNATMVRWDSAAAAWVHARTTPAGVRVFEAITLLGSPTFLVALAVAGAAVLWRRGTRTALIVWLAAFVGGTAFNRAVKTAVQRARPGFGSQFLHGHTYSFPSGHAMGAAIGYGMLAYMLRRSWYPRRRERPVVLLAVGLLVLAIGVSRVYLGVHFPSDVVGGFAAGAAWVAICVTALRVAEHRPAAAPEARRARP